MLATNEPVCPSFALVKNLRAFRQAWRPALLLVALCLAASVPAHAQVSGQNVNMVSGTNWTNGDPFLQRQNEPSIAVSSRNSSHLLAGSNDYRTVDLPGLLGIDERGDAWLGLFKSFDSGRRWQSTLLPGFPLDGSSEGLASPIHGFQAASDPTVRAGTNGLFYYTGIAYNRGANPLSAVFIARFIDLNNKENGSATFENGSMTDLAPRDTIKYIDTQIIGKGTSNVFLDKPWLAVDIPRGSSTCTFSVNQDGKTITQTVPAGPVYVTNTSFVGSGAKQFSQILFRRSLDCGATWSAPVVLSQNNEPFGDAEHQGTVIAIDPSVPSTQPATIYVAWRRFANLNDPDDAPAIFVAKSTDGGRHWAPPVPIVLFEINCVTNPKAKECPYDQDFTTTSFRSNGYPAMTVDAHGKVYIAWSQRDANGDGKIMMGVSPNGTYFPAGSVAQVDIGPVTDDNGASFSNLSGRGSQLMPSLGFANDRLTLVYYDLRQDHTTGIYVPSPDPSCDPMVTLPCTLGAQYFENRAFEGELAPPNPFNSPAVFSPNISDSNPPLTIRRHTIDIMGAQADPLVSSFQVPSFKTFRVSHYEFGSVPALFPDVEQLQYNVPNLPLFVDGTAPFMGDYIDVTGTPQIVPAGGGNWTFNVADTGTAVFHTAWTDNRDVIPPADGNWQNYTPAISASNPGSQPSKFDPTTNPPACLVGQTGMRNQNVYTAEISSGVILTSPQTSKPVLTPTGQPVQREFVVELRNATNAARGFLVTIPTQPTSATASFQQFSTQTMQTVKVNGFSSQSFPVFVVANAGSKVAFPSVLINAVENDGAPVPLSGSILLNPDPTNPALANPDNVTVGANQVSVNEFYNPGLANPGLANPGLANSSVANPGLANPGLANPGLANPQVITALNPGLANPGLANPGLANPGLANPGLANQALTDVSYTITNEGNTSASYTVQFFQSGTLPGAQFQIILSKLYFTQQAVGCQIQQVPTNVIVANVTNPAFVTNPNQLGNPGLANLGLQTPTLNLAPGDSGQITLRTNLSIPQVQNLLLPNISPVAVSQAVNTVDVKQGIFTPPISLIITSTSASLPVGVVNQTYNTTLTSIGGNTGPRIWTITAGSLPPGLQLNSASGAIAGTPTQTGSFPFTAQVMDTGTPQHTATRNLIITIVPPVAITTPSPTLPGGAAGSQYAQTFSAAGGVPPYTWSSTGTLPPGLTLSNTGTLSGMPTTPGTYSFTVKATDSIGLVATAPYTIVVTSVAAPSQISFVVQPSNSVGSQAISPPVQVQVLDASGAAIPGIQVAMNFGNPACSTAILSGSPLATTNASGVATFSNLSIDRGQLGYALRATAGNAQASSFDAAASFGQGWITHSNPNGVWSYGYSSGLANPVTLYDQTAQPGINGPNAQYWLSSSVNIGASPSAEFNNGPAFDDGNVNFLPNEFVLVAGIGGQYSDLVFTAPADGTYSVVSSFRGDQHGIGTLVGVVANGNILFSSSVTAVGQIVPFSTQVSLKAGNTLVFSVGPGGGLQNTGVSATITGPLSAQSGNISAVSNPFNVSGFCATGSLSTPRELHSEVLLGNGKVLIAGGGNNSTGVLNTAELYDPTTGTVSPTGNLSDPSGRRLQATVLLPSGQVLLIGGSDATAELYDPASGTFSPTGSMAQARAFTNAVLLANGKVLVAGGDNGTTLNSAEIYDPLTGLFTPTGNLNQARARHTMTLLPDGTVLVAGGHSFGGSVDITLASAEIFDPAANNGVGAFTSIGTMNSPRAEGRATLLPNGTVLLTGGFVSFQTNRSVSTAEIFDPATNTFALTSNMSVARAAQTASLLPDGTVLIAGGVPSILAPASPTAEIFSPPTGTFSATGPMTMQREYAQAVILLNGNPLITGGDDDSALTGFAVTATEEIYFSTAAAAPLTVTTTSLPNGIVNQVYTRVLLQQGGVGSLTWTLISGALPTGVTLGANGVLSGTPTATGFFQFTVRVVDSSNPQKTVSATLALTIVPTPPLVFTSANMPTAVVGQPYIKPLPVAGGTQPYNGTVTSGTLPPGLTLSGGVLNGTPSGTGSFTFTVTVTDSSTPAKTATQTLTMAVNTLVITTTVLPNGIVRVSYNATIATAGGTLPLSFSLANTAFPPGLSIQQPSQVPLSSTGALAGTPTLAGTYTFSESVVDSSNPTQTATQNYVVTIAPAGTPVPASVTFVSQPQNSVGGQTLAGNPVVVRVLDVTGAPISGASVAMSFNGAPACPVATLSGTLTAVTDGTGQATFSNLSIDRGGFNYNLFASTGNASQSSGPFSVQGFCGSANLSTQREGHTQDLLGTAQSTVKFPVDPKGAYIFTNTNPGPSGAPDIPNAPLVIPLASLGIRPGDVISGYIVGDVALCPVGSSCFGELFTMPLCGVFSSSNTLLPTGGTINRIPGAIAPDFTTAFPCNTPPTLFGNLPTDIPQDFGLFGERVTVPSGAAFLFVALADSFYSDNSDPNGDFGVAITMNSPSSVNGKVLIAGGVDNLGNALNTAELYDPALQFTSPTGNLTDPNGRADHVSVVLPNGKVLLIGGQSNVSVLTSAELYDPASGTFTATGSMAHPRYYAAAVVLTDGRVLVTGGFDTSIGSNTAEIYDPKTGLFTPTGNMSQGRGRHAMTLLPNGKVLVTGGRDSQVNFFALSSAEIFDPFANQGVGAFTPAGNMNSPRHVHTATLLSNGTVLVAGGFNGGPGSPSVVSAETFDPSTGVFTLTGNMNSPRSRHSATLLPDGTVLLAGGVDRFNGISVTAPAELYSPTTRAFSLTGPLIVGRELATATLLPPNGNVLVSGGDDGINELASTEVYYNPVAQTPVVITTSSVANGFISQPYVQILQEQNRSGPIIWSLASGTLPPGITLGANGILSGTPTAVGSFTFTVQVTDGISTATASFTINVSLNPLAFTSNTIPAAGAGRPYSQPLPVVGGTQPYIATVTSGTLPPGLALGSNGVLSGTPSSAGSFTFTASVSDSSTPVQTATQTLTIAVDTLFITTTALPGGMVGVSYNAVISTTGGTLPLTFSNAAFPPGLAIQQPAANSQNGALAGAPTTAGHFTFAESVVDSSTPVQTATQYYVMDIFPAGTTGVPASAIFLSQPQDSVGGQILTGSPIRVRVFDASNTPVVGASVAMSFNGTPPCSSAVLSGTLTAVTNGNGVAVFPDLSIDRGQLGYTLLANAGSAGTVSQPFTVNGFCNISAPVQVGPFAANTLLSNGKALITGGVDAAGNVSAVAQLYDPTTQTFAQTGSMQLPRREQTSTLLADGRVLITGGRGGTAFNSPATATAEIYDPIAGTFALTASPMNFPRRLHTATALADGTVLLAGGRGIGSDQNTAEIFDPKTGSFTLLTATLTTARETHTATLLPDGTVLLAGGSSGGATLSSAEIYNPSTRSFAPVPASMNSPRSVFNTLLLPTGKALLVGGISDPTGTIATATAELYDPSNATFTPTGSMSMARAFFTANLLPSGQVLASGGGSTFTASSTILATAEVYDPLTGTFSQTGSLSASHAQQTSVTLNDGTVLVTQGASTGSDDDVYYSTAPLQITTPTLLRGATQGQPYALVLQEQGGLGALTWTLTGGSLPSGITLSPNGILSGTPTVFGAFLFTVQVTDSSVPPKTATTSYALLVNPFFQFFGTQLITAFSGVAYSNPLPLIGGTPPYSSTLSSGVLPSGLMLANNVISGTTTAAGTYTLTFQATDSSVPPQSATGTLTLGVTTPLVITTTTLPGGLLNSPYNATIATSGGLGTIIIGPTANALPPGLTMDLHGVISGTPTQTGTFSFTVVAFDQSLPPQTFTQPESITITNTNPAPAGSHILFIIQPPGPMGGGSTGLQAVVQLFDANNSPIAGAQLSASFGAKPCPDAALSGTLTAVTDSNGLAAFSGITSNRGGNGYTGVASVTSNPQVFATSIPFNIQGSCPTGNLTMLRRDQTSIAVLPNGKVLIAGGLSTNSAATAVPLNTAELYDPTTGVFSATGNMTTPRVIATTTLLPNGKVLITGGNAGGPSGNLASAELYDPMTGQFTTTGSMATPRQEHAATLLPNGKVLITGGDAFNTGGNFVTTAELYDPGTGQFSSAGTMNAPRASHTATLLPNGQVLLTGGLGGAFTPGGLTLNASAELYDPATGAFTLTGSMTTARENHAATVLPNGTVLITGGYSAPQPSAATTSAEIYDPAAGTFSPAGNMNVARAEHSSTLLPNGTVLIGGGFSSGGFFAGTELSTAETYNPLSGNFKGPANMAFPHSRIVAPLLPNGAVLLASGTTAELFFPTDPPFLVQEFTTTGSLSTARDLHTSTMLSNGLVLIAGGFSNGNILASAELYNPATGTFTATGSMNTARYYHTATPLDNGLVLIAGGLGSSNVSSASAELYNPATGTFTATGSLNTARWDHTATLLPNGTVLIAGGLGSSGLPLASSELYNPATGTFLATGSLNTARVYHTATLLSNGLVLIAGGVQIGNTVTASAELYSPATGTFTATGSLNNLRYFHTATLLNNGLVLIAGGLGSSNVSSASAELYNPATGNFTATSSLNAGRYSHTATPLTNGLVLIAGGSDQLGFGLASSELYNPATGTFTATGSMNAGRLSQTATLLPTGKVLVSGGASTNTAAQATSELYQFGANQQLQPQSCSYEGHIKSIAAFSTPTALRFVNNSTSLIFQILWLDYNGKRVFYAILPPGQSLVQQTFLTHPWVIADTSPASTCQEIYLPLEEQAPAIFPPQASVPTVLFSNVSAAVPPGSGLVEGSSIGAYLADAFEFSPTITGTFTGARIDLWTNTNDGAVSASLYSDGGGTPGTLLAQLGTTTVPFFSSFPFLSFAANNTSFTQTSGPPVALVAGSKYWLALTPGDATSFVLYAIGGATANVTVASQGAPGGAWISPTGSNINVQFEIDGTIP